VDTCVYSSFGTLVMTLFHDIFTAPSWQTFTALACGWTLADDRHTITTYGWLTGAAAVKHFSRFSVFLGCPLYHQRWHLGGRSSAWRSSLSPQAQSCASASTIPPRKKRGPISKGSPATAMAPAQPDKHTGRGGV
jgi:hypothetical protein